MRQRHCLFEQEILPNLTIEVEYLIADNEISGLPNFMVSSTKRFEQAIF